jgi:hypothetical protein
MNYTLNVCDKNIKPKPGFGNCILSLEFQTISPFEVKRVFDTFYPKPRYNVEMVKVDMSNRPLNGW